MIYINRQQPPRQHFYQETTNCFQREMWMATPLLPSQHTALIQYRHSQSSRFMGSIFENLPTNENLLVTPKSILMHLHSCTWPCAEPRKIEVTWLASSRLRSSRMVRCLPVSAHTVNKCSLPGLLTISFVAFSCFLLLEIWQFRCSLFKIAPRTAGWLQLITPCCILESR